MGIYYPQATDTYFVKAENIAKDDLMVIKCYGERAIQPEYEEQFFVIEPPRDASTKEVYITLAPMWGEKDRITQLRVNRYELVEVVRIF